jgi:hypothetical protein
MSISIDFGIGIDQNSWYRTGIVSKPKKLVSPITIMILRINRMGTAWLKEGGGGLMLIYF